MKRTNFLVKLKEEGKLELIEPNEEIQQAYSKKSESYLASAKLLLKNQHLEEAVSMAYYSMYYLLLALLFRVGIKCENHTAAIILLQRVFAMNNEQIRFAKEERIDKQYYVDFHVTVEEVREMIQLAETFNTTLLDFVSKLNTETIKAYRQKAEECMEA